VHLSVIVPINQLDAQMLFHNKFIKRLYMFRSLCAHHQEVKIVYTASGNITHAGGRPVNTLREDFESYIRLIIKQDFVHQVG